MSLKGEKQMQKIRTDMDIGNNIKDIRKKCGLKQKDVIAKLQLLNIDISQSTYAKIETNRMNIKVSELMALKKIFDVDIDEFFLGLY